MSGEKPLHVRVAEALGWTVAVHPSLVLGDWMIEPDTESPTSISHLPRYDTDWSATGPLIERYGIWIHPSTAFHGFWEAGSDLEPMSTYQDRNPLLAVCHFLLAMAEAGTLNVQSVSAP